MSEPWSGGETTATIKFGRGHEDPWLVFKGTPERVKEQIVVAFGTDVEEAEGLTLAELVVNVTKTAQGARTASAGLGGTVIKQGGWARAAQEEAAPAEPAVNPLFAKVEALTAIEGPGGLKDLYARNADAFKADAELMAAWTAKGKALKEASA